MPKDSKSVDNAFELKDLAGHLQSVEATMLKIEELLRENNLLTRILVQPIVLEALQGTFRNLKQMRAYELSDGKRSTREIGKIIRIDQKAISNWWRKWERSEIVDKIGKKGKYKARYSLLELLVLFPSSGKEKSTVVK